MTPTNELRFVERKIYDIEASRGERWSNIRVLQQKWEGNIHTDEGTYTVGTTWRDVPLVKDEA